MFDLFFYEILFIVNELFEWVMIKFKYLYYIRFVFLIVIKVVFFINFMGKNKKIIINILR